jgi:hypothetical protein
MDGLLKMAHLVNRCATRWVPSGAPELVHGGGVAFQLMTFHCSIRQSYLCHSEGLFLVFHQFALRRRLNIRIVPTCPRPRSLTTPRRSATRSSSTSIRIHSHPRAPSRPPWTTARASPRRRFAGCPATAASSPSITPPPAPGSISAAARAPSPPPSAALSPSATAAAPSPPARTSASSTPTTSSTGPRRHHHARQPRPPLHVSPPPGPRGRLRRRASRGRRRRVHRPARQNRRRARHCAPARSDGFDRRLDRARGHRDRRPDGLPGVGWRAHRLHVGGGCLATGPAVPRRPRMIGGLTVGQAAGRRWRRGAGSRR